MLLIFGSIRNFIALVEISKQSKFQQKIPDHNQTFTSKIPHSNEGNISSKTIPESSSTMLNQHMSDKSILPDETITNFYETLNNFNNIEYISKQSSSNQRNISCFSNEILLKILNYVKEKRTRKSFKYVSKNFERWRRQVCFKYRIKKQIKTILSKNFDTKTRITFEQLNTMLDILLARKKIQYLLNSHKLFIYYFTKYFIRNYLIYNKRLDCFFDVKCRFLEKIVEQLRRNLDYKKIIFSYNDKNYFMEILPGGGGLYLQSNYNNKWHIFYAEDWDYSTEEGAQKILKDKKITAIALISNIVSSQERMYSPNDIDKLLKYAEKNQVKIIAQATNCRLDPEHRTLKGFPYLKKVCLRGPTKYNPDFNSLPHLKEISYTVKTNIDKKQYGGRITREVRLEKLPEKNKINHIKTLYFKEGKESDPYIEKYILEYVVMKLNNS